MNRVSISLLTIQRYFLTGVFVVSCFSLNQAAAQQNSGVRAEIMKPEKRKVIRKLKLPATLIADEQVDLYAKTSGYIDQINVDIGSRVKKGDVLTTISVPEMKDELQQIHAILKAKQARVRAMTAKATQVQRTVDTTRSEVLRYKAQYNLDALNLRRREELREANAIPEQALDEARSASSVSKAQLQIAEAKVKGAEASYQAVIADVEVAESDVMVARANESRLKTMMDYATIKAPFDGIITKRQVDHGTFVRSAAEGTTMFLLTIAKTDRIRVVMEVSEIDAYYIRVGTTVLVNIKALGGKSYEGKVSRTAGAVRPDTRTMRVEVDLENSDGVITPGMYAQVTVILETKADATVIKSKAIRTKGNETVVFVVENGVARLRSVQIGYDDGIWAEILSGLQGTEDVITASGGTITPGTVVNAFRSDS